MVHTCHTILFSRQSCPLNSYNFRARARVRAVCLLLVYKEILERGSSSLNTTLKTRVKVFLWGDILRMGVRLNWMVHCVLMVVGTMGVTDTFSFVWRSKIRTYDCIYLVRESTHIPYVYVVLCLHCSKNWYRLCMCNLKSSQPSDLKRVQLRYGVMI